MLRVMGQELLPSQVMDSGYYECVATSSAGETRWGSSLEVQGGSQGRHRTRDTMAPGLKPPQISIHLSTDEGSSLSPPSPEPGLLPKPPSTPVVTNITKSSVTLSWKENEDSGATGVTSYIVEAFRYHTSTLSVSRGDVGARCHPTIVSFLSPGSQAVGGPWQTVAADVESETYTVSGLVPDTVYLFVVRAVNAYGLSDPSGISEPVRTQGKIWR